MKLTSEHKDFQSETLEAHLELEHLKLNLNKDLPVSFYETVH